MYRFSLDYLKEWKVKQSRKPIVIRGARQVGKSYLVRMFAEKEFENLIEINFEQTPELMSLFASRSPRKIIGLLETKFNTKINESTTLIFLDEIQAAPEVIATLRYFYEEMPRLHVIAAGSLLEFALEEHTFSMPVGRIEYLHMGHMFFEEFLIAAGKNKLQEYICNYQLKDEIPDAIHLELINSLKQYFVVGGMPEAVLSFVSTNSYQDCDSVKQSILSTFRDDFNKYSRRVKNERIEKIFNKVPLLIGKKLKYSQVDREERSKDLRHALNLLCLARVMHRVHHSSANGIPLGAEMDESMFKVLFLDIGLLCKSLGLSIMEFESAEDIIMVNAGAVSEQFVGQHLLYSRNFFEAPELFYWLREKKNSNAEVDYIISVGPNIIPVEVKSGKSGTMKSLQLFIHEKKRDVGLRFNSDKPSVLNTKTSIPGVQNSRFKLISLPIYMVGQARRLLKTE